MAVKYERVCDFTHSDVMGEHASNQMVEVKVGNVTMKMDVCDHDITALSKMLRELGFKPSRARVGKDTRDAYVGASGEPFTSRQARTWLIEVMGHDIAPTGRLTNEQLREYADTH